MTYVLGTAPNTSAPLRLTFTCANDGWDSLAAAYGVKPQDIINMQPELVGKQITNAVVQAFVKSRAGWSAEDGLYPFNPTSNPGTVDARGQREGFAHFTSKTQLMLPDMPRLDGKTPSSASGGAKITTPLAASEVRSEGMNPLVIVAGLGLIGAAYVASRSKKQSRG